MKPSDKPLAILIQKQLLEFDRNIVSLPGIHATSSMVCFVEQIIDSIRRIKYARTLQNKPMSNIYADANNIYFDPIKASIWYFQQGHLDEAFWMVFFATHFGKNLKTGWGLAKATYGALSNSVYWDWVTTSSNPLDFRRWLSQNQIAIKSRGNFSNHRKYQSIDAFSPAGTGAAFESYINWIGNGHESFVNNLIATVGNDPRILFNAMYNSMSAVKSFGRTAKFDYLTMIGKLGLVNIEPDSTYMVGATGPKSGGRLLFGGRANSDISENKLSGLIAQVESHLNLYFGMQVLEDALCNWQKSPNHYIHFSG